MGHANQNDKTFSTQHTMTTAIKNPKVNTHDFDPVSGGGSDVPGALFPAGVLVRPVGAAESSAGTVDLVFTFSWSEREENNSM